MPFEPVAELSLLSLVSTQKDALLDRPSTVLERTRTSGPEKLKRSQTVIIS